MAKPLVPDELWAIVEPLLPPHPNRPGGGRRPVDDRARFAGILVCTQGRHRLGRPARRDGLRHGLPATARRPEQSRRVRAAARGTACPAATARPDRHRFRPGRQRLRAGRFWGQKTGPNPTDRAKAGTEHHALADANGVPLSATVTAADRHDVTELLALVDDFPTTRGKPGRPLTKPKAVIGDRGYDSHSHRQQLRGRHIDPVPAERNTGHGSGSGILRWPVERTTSWLHQACRLRVR